MVNDIDIDIGKLMEGIPDDHVAFYFRASDYDIKDFASARGDLEMMAEALANIMKQSEQLSDMIQAAVAYYLE